MEISQHELATESRAKAIGRVIVIMEAVVDALTGCLDDEKRGLAERAAHKIASVANAAGNWEMSELAREAEAAFRRGVVISDETATRLERITARLLDELSLSVASVGAE